MRMIIDSNDDTVNVNANASDDWCKNQDTCCKNMKRWHLSRPYSGDDEHDDALSSWNMIVMIAMVTMKLDDDTHT